MEEDAKSVEKLMKIVNEREEVPIDELAGELKKSVKEIKKLIKILEKYKMIKVKKRFTKPDLVRSLLTYKEKTVQKIEEVKKKISKMTELKESVKTEADKIVDLVIAYERIKLGRLAELLEDTPENVEKLARILDEHNIVRLVYPENPFAEPYLKRVEEE